MSINSLQPLSVATGQIQFAWDIITANTHFLSPHTVALSRKGKSKSRKDLFSWERMPPLPWWKSSNVTNLQADGWLILCAILGTQGWSLLLAVWELSIPCSQSRTVGHISVLLSSCMTSIPTSMATSFTSPLCKDRSDWRNRLTDLHRISHLVQGVQTFSHIFIYEHLQWTQISLYSGSIGRGLCIYFSNRCPGYQISIMFLFIFFIIIFFTIQPNY